MNLAGLLMLAVAVHPIETPLSVLGETQLVCPVCGKTFTAVVSSQANTREGVDRDLFARALGPQPVFYQIATCPACGYSGYPSDFGENVLVPPDVRSKIVTERALKLPPGFGPQSDPRELDAADRYALAITCYGWLQKSDEAMAWLHLRASWVARDEGSVLPQDPRLARVMKYIERWRPTMQANENQVDVEMKLAARMAEALAAGLFNRYQKPYVELALALILRRHGENRLAQPMLDRLVHDERFSDSLRQSMERMRESIKKERQHQAAAASCFESALLAGRIAPANRASAHYVLGELCRRLGRDDEAIQWYDKALADPTLAADLQTWARQQRTWCQSGKR